MSPCTTGETGAAAAALVESQHVDESRAAAFDCILNASGTYYDVCAEHCETERIPYTFFANEHVEETIYGQLFPVLIALVVVANVLVVIVLNKRHMITPTNVVLKYMAVAEMCVGLVPLPWLLFYFTLGANRRPDTLSLWWCWAQKMSMDSIPPVFHFIAMWSTVLLAGQRFVSIRYPIRSRSICSVRNVRIITVIITLASLSFGLLKAFDAWYEVLDTVTYSIAEDQFVQTKKCVFSFAGHVRLMGIDHFFQWYFTTRVVVFILIPSFLLTALNALLIAEIRRAERRKAALLKENKTKEARAQNDNNQTSTMLVVIVTIFLLVNLPQAFFMSVLIVENSFGVELPLFDSRFRLYYMLVSNLILMATYPINFGIYCFMSSSFRQTFTAIFCQPHSVARKFSDVLFRDSTRHGTAPNTTTTATTTSSSVRLDVMDRRNNGESNAATSRAVVTVSTPLLQQQHNQTAS